MSTKTKNSPALEDTKMSKAAVEALAGIPTCRVRRAGGALTVSLRVTGLLAAGARFEVVPVFGPVPPTREEAWNMTVGVDGADHHVMRTDAKHLEGDGINFQVNLCALHNQFASGSFDVTVEQDGEDCPIVPPLRFVLQNVPPCQSPAAKLVPTSRVGGFAFDVA